MDINQLELDIQKEINQIRENPSCIIPELKEFAKNFKGKYYKIPNTNINIVTNEGVSAVLEAIDYLSQVVPCKSLQESKGLYLAARDHAKDLSESGQTSHIGLNGSRMNERIERYGEWDHSIAENIVFDDSHPRDIVFGMIIDDGNKSRGHRRNILNSEFHHFGVACSKHPKHKWVTVIDFAVEFQEKSDRPGIEHTHDTFRKKTTIVQDAMNRQEEEERNMSASKQAQLVSNKEEYNRMSKNQQKGVMERAGGETRYSFKAKLPERVLDQNNLSVNDPTRQQIIPKKSNVSVKSEINSMPVTQLNSQTSKISGVKLAPSKSPHRKHNKNHSDKGSNSKTSSHLGDYDFENDPDRPDGSVSVKIKQHIRTKDGHRFVKLTKIYEMKNGENEIIEIIDC